MLITKPGRLRKEHKQLLRAALLRPKNVLVLGTGCVAGIFAYPILIPIGILAYGLLCYLDINSEEFINAVLHPSPKARPVRKTLQSNGKQPQPSALTTTELQQLHARMMTAYERLQQLYHDPAMLAEKALGDIEQIASLIEKSTAFLEKAQSIRDYLKAEDVGVIQREMESLQKKIGEVDDEFAQRQYQQAIAARHKQLDTLRDIQRMYERLVSQVTNITVSLDTLHSRVMKLKTTEYSLAQLESEHLSEQLTDLLEDVEQLEQVLSEVFV